MPLCLSLLFYSSSSYRRRCCSPHSPCLQLAASRKIGARVTWMCSCAEAAVNSTSTHSTCPKMMIMPKRSSQEQRRTPSSTRNLSLCLLSWWPPSPLPSHFLELLIMPLFLLQFVISAFCFWVKRKHDASVASVSCTNARNAVRVVLTFPSEAQIPPHITCQKAQACETGARADAYDRFHVVGLTGLSRTFDCAQHI